MSKGEDPLLSTIQVLLIKKIVLKGMHAQFQLILHLKSGLWHKKTKNEKPSNFAKLNISFLNWPQFSLRRLEIGRFQDLSII